MNFALKEVEEVFGPNIILNIVKHKRNHSNKLTFWNCEDFEEKTKVRKENTEKWEIYFLYYPKDIWSKKEEK